MWRGQAYAEVADAGWFDNAENPAALARYLPGSGGQVVITSRNPGWHELATPVEVDVFDRGESIILLRDPKGGACAIA